MARMMAVKRFRRMNMCTLAFVCALLSMTSISWAFDPYEEIGVSSRASPEQIKKAYRKLAREWHPDRNRAKGANEKFMRINEAYETLSDPEKRAEYDNFGRTAGQSQGGGGGGGRGGGGFHEFFQQGSPFSGFHGFGGFRHGGFDGGGSQRRNSDVKDRVTMQQFLNDIEGGGGSGGGSGGFSSEKPYIFFVTGTMCFMCMQLEPIWEQAAAELKAASYGVGRVLGDADQALARRLGVKQLPEIVAFVNGEAVSMKTSRYNVRGIVDFASDALTTASSSSSSAASSSSLPPFADVRVLESSSAFDSFVSGWRSDNLVRTLFIGPRTTLRFSVPCFAMRKRHLCAFVHSSQPWILDKGIYSHMASERVVVLLEDSKSPAASVTASRIPVETIRQTMRDNQWLLLPRLSSQTVLDELCPVSSSSKSSSGRGGGKAGGSDDDGAATKKTFCVVLLTATDDDRSRRSVETFRKYAREFKQNHSHHHHLYGDGEESAPRISFAYLFKDTQGAFFEALERRRPPPSFAKPKAEDASEREEDDDGVEDEGRKKRSGGDSDSGGVEFDVDPIALLWRNSAEALRFDWAPLGWPSPAADGAAPTAADADGDVAASSAAAAAAAKRERKRLVRQSQSSLSAFIAQILSTPSSELHEQLVAASAVPHLWDEHQGNLLVRGWKAFRASIGGIFKFIRVCLSYLLGSDDVWFSYFSLFLTLGVLYLISYFVSAYVDADDHDDDKKTRRKNEKKKSKPSSSSSSSFWEKKRQQQQQEQEQQRRSPAPSSNGESSSSSSSLPHHHAVLEGTSIQLLQPDLYERYVLEARGLGVRVLVLVVPHGLYGAEVTPRQGWWAYPSAAAILKRHRSRGGASSSSSIHAKLASQFSRMTEPLLRQDRRLVLTMADQLLHADWLHDLIDPVLDRNGITIPELPPVGLCLALHGARRYFSLYWPPGDEEEEAAGGGGSFLGMDDREESGSRPPPSLDATTFSAWLERLMDGQLPRLHVETWPEDLATEERGEEDEESS